MTIRSRLQERSRQALPAELSPILSHPGGGSRSPQTPGARQGHKPAGLEVQSQAGRARCSRSYKPRWVGSLDARCSSRRRVRSELEVGSQAAPNTIQPLGLAPSCTGAPQAQGTQLWACLELSFSPPGLSLVSTKHPRVAARFPSACLQQSFLLERGIISQSFPTSFPGGEGEALGM